MGQMISKYLSYAEAIKSATAIKLGIDNTPSKDQLLNVTAWAIFIFDKCREYIKNPLGCQVVYRCPALNKAVGGAKDSQHMALKGAAGDIDCDLYGFGNNEDLFDFILKNLDFDQLIAEGLQNKRIEWIHCSYVNSAENRHKVLLMYVKDGKTIYENYSPERLKQLIS
jgi:hypothetical protein